MNLKIFLILSFSLCFISLISAQTTTVTGRVFDGESGNPLPFVNVSFAGTSNGTMTNIEGKYELISEIKVSRIIISFLGYATQNIVIQKQVSQKIDIALEPKWFELNAAEVRPDKERKNPAKPLMQRVADAKKSNDPSRIPAVSYNYHERLELDLNDIPEKLPVRKLWGAFAWVWDGLDSSEARVSLPTFFSESVGTIRTQMSPKRAEKRIEAARATWLSDGESTSSVASEFFDINLYENQLLLLNKAFTSPLHDRGNLHYRYYILDTLEMDNRPAFHLAFVPRRRGELTFEGELWIDTLSLALRKVEAKISEGANLNFVRALRWKKDYQLIDSAWVVVKTEEIMDISMTGSSMGIYARSTVINTDFEFAEQWQDSVWTSKRDLSFAEGSNEVLESVWASKRPEPLNVREKSIYEMADSVQTMGQYKFLKSLIYGIGSGYIQLGKIEIGPWYSSFSKNTVEDNRFRLGVETSNAFSRKVLPSAFIAYGSLDRRIKYGADIIWLQRKHPRIEWYASHQRDIEQMGMLGFFEQGNIFNNALSLEGGQDQLAEVSRSEASLFTEYGAGWSTLFEVRHRSVKAKGGLEFQLPTDPDGNATLITAESTIQVRYAHDEKFVSGAFERLSLGSRLPIVTATMTHAWPGVAGSQYKYGRFSLNLEGKMRLGPLGRVEWMTQGGLYTGTAPFPLMELQPANETILSIQPSFNLLRYFELVTDQWVRGGAEWHGEGLVLNRIPLIRRAGLREVVGIKAVIGSWDPKHEELVSLPVTTTGLNGIYAEGVVGIENIFHFLRIDAHLRLTESTDNMRDMWGIRIGLSLEL